MWPTPQDYNESIQNPRSCFADPELANALPVLNTLGIPKPVSGAFASVYQMDDANGKQYAVRCFLREVPDQAARYAAISKKLKQAALPYMVPFEYLEQGIKVHDKWFPILKMQWVNGQPLVEWLLRRLDDAEAMTRITLSFREMCKMLSAHGIAHGDLQHGNIIVVGDQIKLVDYDGMFVPELEGFAASELGHRHYQHPSRSSIHFDKYLDNFSAWSIYTSLVCLTLDPLLWRALEAGDECLLFRQEDYVSPEESPAFRLLEHHDLLDIQRAAQRFRVIRSRNVEDVPAVSDAHSIDESSATMLPKLRPIFTPGTTGNASAKTVREAVRVALAERIEQPKLKVVQDESEGVLIRRTRTSAGTTGSAASAAPPPPNKVPVHVLPGGTSKPGRKKIGPFDRDGWTAIAVILAPIFLVGVGFMLRHSGPGPSEQILYHPPATSYDRSSERASTDGGGNGRYVSIVTWDRYLSGSTETFATAHDFLNNNQPTKALSLLSALAKELTGTEQGIVVYHEGLCLDDMHEYAKALAKFKLANSIFEKEGLICSRSQLKMADDCFKLGQMNAAYKAYTEIQPGAESEILGSKLDGIRNTAIKFLESNDEAGFGMYEYYLHRGTERTLSMDSYHDMQKTADGLEAKKKWAFAFKVRQAAFDYVGWPDPEHLALAPTLRRSYREKVLLTAIQNRRMAGDHRKMKQLQLQLAQAKFGKADVLAMQFGVPAQEPKPRTSSISEQPATKFTTDAKELEKRQAEVEKRFRQ